jgi:hypothetical protein
VYYQRRMNSQVRKMLSDTTGDDGLQKVIGQMTGATDPDPAIAVPMYLEIHKRATNVYTLVKFLAAGDNPVGKLLRAHYPGPAGTIDMVCASRLEELATAVLEKNDGQVAGTDLVALNANPELLAQYMSNIKQEYKVQGLGPKFNGLKACKAVQEVVLLLRNMQVALKQEQERTASPKHDLEDKADMRDGFILNCDGDVLELYPFVHLNFKEIFLSDRLDPAVRKLLLTNLHMTLQNSQQLLDQIRKPPVDISKFGQMMVDGICVIKNEPELSRCTKAFDHIRRGANLMTDNFPDYWRNFVVSGSVASIAEGFIMDVANGSKKTDAETSLQFRMIAAHFAKTIGTRTSAAGGANIQGMLGMLYGHLDSMDQGVEGGKAAPKPMNKPIRATKIERPVVERVEDDRDVDALAAQVEDTKLKAVTPPTPKLVAKKKVPAEEPEEGLKPVITTKKKAAAKKAPAKTAPGLPLPPAPRADNM